MKLRKVQLVFQSIDGTPDLLFVDAIDSAGNGIRIGEWSEDGTTLTLIIYDEDATSIRDYKEINTSNYGHDDVCETVAWANEAASILDEIGLLQRPVEDSGSTLPASEKQ